MATHPCCRKPSLPFVGFTFTLVSRLTPLQSLHSGPAESGRVFSFLLYSLVIYHTCLLESGMQFVQGPPVIGPPLLWINSKHPRWRHLWHHPAKLAVVLLCASLGQLRHDSCGLAVLCALISVSSRKLLPFFSGICPADGELFHHFISSEFFSA